jgi:hypothetical protein
MIERKNETASPELVAALNEQQTRDTAELLKRLPEQTKRDIHNIALGAALVAIATEKAAG